MPHIRKLDPSLVNKIAAGEVIERPASVVKELLENSLDAGATRIDVALEDGGVGLIRVTDNGRGMSPEDLPLAIAPHATSKISTSDDLFAINTLGFRGEALASIASVSHLRIVSRPEGQTEGCELIATDGQVQGPRACAAPTGTTIEIRNLFYNVPARRKFLKQGPTEFSHATEQLARLALAHPEVAFSLSHNGRSSRTLPVTTHRRERIGDFYGTELAACLLPIDRNERGVRIEALIAPPAQSRASSKWQYLFLNGRYITDRRITFAVREAFRGLVEHSRYPVVFIFLTTPPDAYDVNVHPTKIEVRWRDAGLIQSQVLAVLRETLLSHDLTPQLGFDRPALGPPGGEHQARSRQALADYLKSVDPTQARLGFVPPRFPSQSVRPSLRSSSTSRLHDPASGNAPPASRDGLSSPIPSDLAAPPAHTSNDPASLETAAPQDHLSAGAPPDAAAGSQVIQVHNTYLVAQTEEGIVIIDQHALHERILYERFRERILAGSLESQRLLIPPAFDASPAQVQAAEDHAELLSRIGVEVSPFGPKSLAVQCLPALLGEIDPADFVRDLLDKLADQDRIDSGADAPGHDARETLLHAALDMMACKAAVKAGDPLTQEEMLTLLDQRHVVDRSSNCPHGRPTTLQLSTRDLERQFKRT